MLKFLFPRLTADPGRGSAAFDAATRLSRRPGWYSDAGIPDTLDGRFAVLATVIALVLVRLDQLGDEGRDGSVALTERFVAVMEAEHRELGLGDPSLGKTVRRLVGSLGRRNGLWTQAVAGQTTWDEAVADSLYADPAAPGNRQWSADALRELWSAISGRTAAEIAHGELA